MSRLRNTVLLLTCSGAFMTMGCANAADVGGRQNGVSPKQFALKVSFSCDASNGPYLNVSFKNESGVPLRMRLNELPFSTSGRAMTYAFNKAPADDSIPLFRTKEEAGDVGLIEIPNGSEVVGMVPLRSATPEFFRVNATASTFITWDYSHQALEGAKLLGQSGGIYLSMQELEKCDSAL